MIRNCRIDDAGEHNIFITIAGVNVGLGFTIADCKIQSARKAGVYIEDTGNIVFNNNFFESNNEEDVSWGDIHVAASATNLELITVSGGFHTPGSSGATTSRGLYAAAGRHVLVLGMHLRGSGYARGVECTAAVANATILNSYFESAAVDVLFDPATKTDYQKSGAKFFGGSGASGVFDASDMQVSCGTNSGGLVGIGTFNSLPTIQASGTSNQLNLNPVSGSTQISVNTSGNGTVKLGGLITVMKYVTSSTTFDGDVTTVYVHNSGSLFFTKIPATGVNAGRLLFIGKCSTGLTITLVSGTASRWIVAGVDRGTVYALPAGAVLRFMSNGVNWISF